MDNMLTAGEARKLTDESYKTELDKIMSDIERAAKSGSNHVDVYKDISDKRSRVIVQELTNLGYSIEFMDDPRGTRDLKRYIRVKW